MLQDVANDRAEEDDIAARSCRHIQVCQRGRARIVRVNMYDFGSLFLRLHHVSERDGMRPAILLPMIRMASLLTRSCGKVVAPPRPSEVPRPGTVELCQIRAWFSIETIPRPPVRSFFIR